MRKSVFVFACLVFIVYMMRQNDMTFSRGLRHSFKALEKRVLDSGARKSTTLCDGISFGESYSEGDTKRAQGFISDMKKIRKGNPLEDWILNGSEDTIVKDYLVPLIPWLAPWAVLAIFTLFACFAFVTSWCCTYGCCKNCCQFCKCCKAPKTQGKTRLYMAISGALLLCTAGSAIAGIVFSPRITKGVSVTFCSALVLVENMVHGQSALDWMGFNTILSSLSVVRTQFSHTVDNLNMIAGSQADMDSAYNDAIDENKKFYTQNKGKTDVPRADPAKASVYTPDYIANLGPPSTSNTYTNLIQTEMQLWYTVISTATSTINQAVNSLKSQQFAIQSALNSGIRTAKSITDSLNSVIDFLDDSSPIAKDVMKAISYGLLSLFVVNIVFSFVAVFSIAMVGVLKKKFFTKPLHLSWCIINIVTLIGFILATVTLPASVVMMEACDIFHLTLNDKVFFNKITDKIFSGESSDAKTILNTCFYGSGNALDELGLTQQLSYFDTIYDQLDEIDQIIDMNDLNYNSTNPPPSQVIPAQRLLVGQYKSGALPDKDVTVTDLFTLNAGTNSNVNPCISIQDSWALNSGSCVSSGFYKFKSSDAENKNVGSRTCIGFDQWMSPTPKNIDLRYSITRFPPTCSNPSSTRVKSLVDGFVINRNKVQNYFTTVQNDLSSVNSKFNDFSSQMMTFVDNMKQIKTNVQNMKDSLIGDSNGLITNTNCRFVSVDLKDLQASMCTGLMAGVYQATIAMIVMTVTALLSTIFTFCLAKKLSIHRKRKALKLGQIAVEGKADIYAVEDVNLKI